MGDGERKSGSHITEKVEKDSKILIMWTWKSKDHPEGKVLQTEGSVKSCPAFPPM